MNNEKIQQNQEDNLGEMINVWIEHHGYLDFDTDDTYTFGEFKNKVQKDEKFREAYINE